MPDTTNTTTTILSVFPVALRSIERKHRAHLHYECPAAKRDKIIRRVYRAEVLSALGPIPAGPVLYEETTESCEVGRGYVTVTIPDTWQYTRDFSQEDSTVMVPHALPSRTNAEDLVREWTNCVTAGVGRVGVRLIAQAEPTEEEYRSIVDDQSVLAHRLVSEATSHHSKGDLKEIHELHRAMAQWIGAENLPWVPRFENVEMKNCKACGERIRKIALKCKECGSDLVQVWKDLIQLGVPVVDAEDPVAISTARQAIDASSGRKRAA